MASATHNAAPGAPAQRDALEKSEREASTQQPENYKDAATGEKIVEIPPVPKDEAPIKGLDPK